MVSHLIWRCATAAVFSTLKPTAIFAFRAGPLLSSNTGDLKNSFAPSRLYFSKKINNNGSESDESMLNTAKSKIKSFLPSFLRQDDKRTREAEIVKKRNDLSSGIDSLLKDAPLPVRLMGKMISPIIGQVAGTMVEAMEEQSRLVGDMMEDARNLIIQDDSVVRELGTQIEVGTPFNQSSSSMSVNGQTKSSVQAQFEVQGSTGRRGIATISQENGRIISLNLNINGRTISIDVNRRGGVVGGTSSSSRQSSGSVGKNRNFNEGDFIDVEFIDKVKK